MLFLFGLIKDKRTPKTPKSAMKLVEFADMLLEGQQGDEVFSLMRSAIKSVCALRVAVSRVRDLVLTSSDPRRFHPKHKKHISKMKRVEKSSKVDVVFKEFLNYDLKQKNKAKRRLRSNGKFFGDKALDELLSTLPILPDNFQTFRLTKKIAKRCAEVAKHNLRVKNENVKIMENGSANYSSVVDYVNLAAARIPGVTISVPKLAVCLLFLSGRRSSEILNGKSVFTPGSTPMSVFFTGQLKKNTLGDVATSTKYEIPILCLATTFLSGMAVLRDLQGNVQLENAFVNKKYAANLRFWVLKLFKLKENANSVASQLKVHDLRALYVNFAYYLFQYENEGLTMNAFAEWALGHENIETSLSYNSISVKNLPPLFPSSSRLAAPKLGARQKRVGASSSLS